MESFLNLIIIVFFFKFPKRQKINFSLCIFLNTMLNMKNFQPHIQKVQLITETHIRLIKLYIQEFRVYVYMCVGVYVCER